MPHGLLIVHADGIRCDATNWIKSSFRCRKQRVVLKGVYSESTGVISGVPRGSSLGPFVISSLYS